MGEYADMMLDGTLCETCGAYIGRDCGYPQYCSKACAAESGIEEPDLQHQTKPYACAQCSKRFATEGGLRQHTQVKHKPDKTPCPGCGKLCTGDLGLRDHMQAKGCRPGHPGGSGRQNADPEDDFDVIEEY